MNGNVTVDVSENATLQMTNITDDMIMTCQFWELIPYKTRPKVIVNPADEMPTTTPTSKGLVDVSPTQKFLDNAGVGHLYQFFKENGTEIPMGMIPALEHKDLEYLGVTGRVDRFQIIMAARRIVTDPTDELQSDALPPNTLGELSPVELFLEKAGVGHLYQLFVANGSEIPLEMILAFGHKDLEYMGITGKIDRFKIIMAARRTTI